ncbi:MAG: P1 family peptidase [Thermoplasmata archaeon]|nr:P1 family peptidase [Thermoplasmata archaeon]
MPSNKPHRTITSVPGVRVGQVESEERTTGVTCLLFDAASPTSVDVRGGASCTYDTASLAPDATFGRRWALFFSGGSVFGLDAARGVRVRVLENGGGHAAFGNPNRVAPVSGATLFDLPTRLGPVPDYLPLGYEAARRASDEPVRLGRFGAGTGATIGKYLGRDHSMPGAVGSAAVRVPRGPWVGVLVVLNSVGAVRDPDSGRWLAGARDRAGRIVPPGIRVRPGRAASAPSRGTTLVAVVTDAALDRRTLQRVAVGAHTGMARAVVPTHTATDGDVVFASCTGNARRSAPEGYPGQLGDTIGSLAAELVVEAIKHGVAATTR